MSFLRTLAERLSRGRTFRRKIVVSGKACPIVVSPDAQLKYLKPGSGVFDQDLVRIAEQQLTADSVVWDIGANVGVFTFAADSVAHRGTVISVEADIWLANILRRTARFKAYEGIDLRILPAAVSDQTGVAVFTVASRGRASNALEAAGGRSQMGGVREKQYVPTTTFDAMLASFPPPDFVKIDIEGAEVMAIRGGEKLLSEVRPVFYIEVGKSVSDTMLSTFRAARYAAFDPEGRHLTDTCASNTFFVPEEKAADWQA
ncbi:MAG: FkbM family methyltransferase [Phycisphaerales bacterium JB063]